MYPANILQTLQSFHRMQAFCMQIWIFFRFVKGRYHGNQLMLGDRYHLHYLHSVLKDLQYHYLDVSIKKG